MPARRPRNRGAFRKAGVADPAPLLAPDADEVSRAAKVLAAARKAKPAKEARSAWVWRHVAAMKADIARLRVAAAQQPDTAARRATRRPEPTEAQPDLIAGEQDAI